MKIFSVRGYKKSGKTTVATTLIRRLKEDGFKVGSIKSIHIEGWHIDTPGTNSHAHKEAGAEPVAAWGLEETAIIFPRRLRPMTLLKYFNNDWLVVEGSLHLPVPEIVCAKNVDEARELRTGLTFMFSGVISNELDELDGLPVVNPLTQPDRLYEIVREKVFPALPFFDCGDCGTDCTGMAELILKGEKTIKDCVMMQKDNVQIFVGGKRVPLNPFVQNIIGSVLKGAVYSLKGVEKGKEIRVKILDPELL